MRGAITNQMIAAPGDAWIQAANTILPTDYLWTHKGRWTGFISGGRSISLSEDLKSTISSLRDLEITKSIQFL